MLCFTKLDDVEIGSGIDNCKKFIPSMKGYYLVTKNAVRIYFCSARESGGWGE